MNNNYLVSVALACLLGMNPIIAETQIGSSKKSLFKTLLEDFRCMRQKGFKRCSPQQQGRIVTTGAALAIVLLSASGVGIWFGVGKPTLRGSVPVGGADEPSQQTSGGGVDAAEGEEDETEPAEGPIRPATSTEIAGASDPVVQQLVEKANVGEEPQTSLEYLNELGALLAEAAEEREGDPAPDAADDEEAGEDDVDASLAVWEKANEADKAETAAKLAAADSATE